MSITDAVRIKLVRRVLHHIRLNTVRLLARLQTGTVITRFGSDWGGWDVAAEDLSQHSVIYSGGIGQDATFDVAMIDAIGCEVHAFDPTPLGRAYAEQVAAREPNFHFYPWGLWHEDGVKHFYAPYNPGHDSYSIVNLGGTSAERAVTCDVRRLPTIMTALGHDRIDLLKIDIEGAEHAVLGDMLNNHLDVRQVCVEFDQPAPLRRTLSLIRTLREHGYVPVARNRWDWTFVRAAPRRVAHCV